MSIWMLLALAVCLAFLIQFGGTRPDPQRDNGATRAFLPRWPFLRSRSRVAWCEAEASQGGYEERSVAVLHCNAGPEAHGWLKASLASESCLDRFLACGGESACSWSCLHEGDCAQICPVDAIVMRQGLPQISERTCTGCGDCVTACPSGVLGLVPRDSQLHLVCQNCDTGPARQSACDTGCQHSHACLTENHGIAGLVGNLDGRRLIDYTHSTNLLPLLALCPSGSFKDRIPHRPWFTVNDHCTACGDCIPLCPAADCILPAGEAADTPTGSRRVRIEPARCVGCGLCVPACEVQAIRVVGAVGYQEQA
jgi:Fe-S-cluster-containing hydrogenase component 2